MQEEKWRMAAAQELNGLNRVATAAAATLAEGEATFLDNSIEPKSLNLHKEQTLSHFRFYWQEKFSEPNATSIEIVSPVPKYNTTAKFGSIRAIDIALTIGPNVSSKVVGRAQGVYVSASETEIDLLMIENIVFYEGRYHGSSITAMGRNPIFSKVVRELDVVGGSGHFRFAKGYAELRTISSDPKTLDTAVQYDVYVYHY
ncbi:hypothetical protein Ahy_A02g006554 [Arachis hypogaea]|uniref:Dirigent protein n=1 Tax=Arachis hypogaea TaxID=3818 RepID=A0A445EA01_ARAHY|nr:hypothetical protein Ahy_A02g006554 [Arachis hypogaea]